MRLRRTSECERSQFSEWNPALRPDRWASESLTHLCVQKLNDVWWRLGRGEHSTPTNQPCPSHQRPRTPVPQEGSTRGPSTIGPAAVMIRPSSVITAVGPWSASITWPTIRSLIACPERGCQLGRGGWRGTVGSDKESIKALACKGGEGRIDLADRSGVEDNDAMTQTGGRERCRWPYTGWPIRNAPLIRS
jgi:hypothetical protein